MNADSLETTRHALQSGLIGAGLAGVFLAAGIACVVLWRLRSREPLLLWLGVFTLMYGARLLAENHLVRLATSMTDAAAYQWDALFTCCILIPCALFFRELFGPRWRKLSNVWLSIQLIFAPAAILLGILTKYWAGFWTFNNVLAIAGSLFVAWVLISRWSDHPMTLRVSLIAFFIVVLANNFGFRFRGQNVEPLGFAVLIAGLGYMAAHRANQREQKLTEVEHELEMARRIQASILPQQLPEIAGLRLAARHSSMTAVAGDFYDFLAGDGRTTLLLADVAGHGVPAALVAAMLKTAFAAQSDNAGDPARILAGLNAALASVPTARFVTAVCALVDPIARRITYAAAGHPPALLVRDGGREVVELTEGGLMLGPFAHAQFSNAQADFDPGDKLLFYTDGIIEAADFDMDRLKDFACRNGGTPAAQFVDHLFQAVSGPVQEDDLTVVVVQSV